MTLRARVLIGLGVIAVVLGVVGVAVLQVTRRHLVDQVDDQLRLTELRGPGDYDDRSGGPGDVDDQGPGPPSPAYVGLIDADGSLTAIFLPNLGEDATPVVDADRARSAGRTGDPFTVGSDEDGVRYRMIARTVGDQVLVVGLPLTDVDDAIARLRAIELIAAAVTVAALGTVAFWVIRLGVRPVKEMAATATEIGAGDLSTRVPEYDRRTEAGQLGVALNRMLGRLEEAFGEQVRSERHLRQFVADASHELRTPVTTIRGYAELYRSDALADPDALAEAMRRVEQETIRMGDLVDDLLRLARLDQGRPLERAPVDLAALASDAARDAEATDATRPVRVEADGPVVVAGDERLLRQVVANLVGNALVHTDPGTPVTLRVGMDDGRAVLEVADEGPGMTPEQAARVFERFYRADPSRSRHRGGTGLGLAIVQATVEAHGGEVDVTSTPGHGATFRVELPTG